MDARIVMTSSIVCREIRFRVWRVSQTDPHVRGLMSKPVENHWQTHVGKTKRLTPLHRHVLSLVLDRVSLAFDGEFPFKMHFGRGLASEDVWRGKPYIRYW